MLLSEFLKEIEEISTFGKPLLNSNGGYIFAITMVGNDAVLEGSSDKIDTTRQYQTLIEKSREQLCKWDATVLTYEDFWHCKFATSIVEKDGVFIVRER